jgi:hypothetical protein
MLSTQSLAVYAGSFLGSTLLGAIAEGSSISNAWIVAAVLSMVSLALYAHVAKQQPDAGHSHEEATPILDGR